MKTIKAYPHKFSTKQWPFVPALPLAHISNPLVLFVGISSHLFSPVVREKLQRNAYPVPLLRQEFPLLGTYSLLTLLVV